MVDFEHNDGRKRDMTDSKHLHSMNDDQPEMRNNLDQGYVEVKIDGINMCEKGNAIKIYLMGVERRLSKDCCS